MPEALHPLAPSVSSWSDTHTHTHTHTHRGTIYFLLLLYSLCWSTIWNLNSPNRSIFLNPTLTEGSNPEIKSVRPLQRIIQKNVPKRPCPEGDFNA